MGRGAQELARTRRRLRASRWLVPLVLVAVAFLYWRPLASYLETHADVQRREAEVARLRVAKAQLERRLERSASLDQLRREARRIGFVRPGERLFIVKGIHAWRRAHDGTVSVDGGS